MATLTTDLVGRVKRLPLKPSSTSALLPMFEAVSNGLHAIDDRFGGSAKTSGRIDIEVLREDRDKPNSPIVGFVITDNGIGLNDQNYGSFLKPDSQHKINRGGKGVGRLGWLKVFKNINVNSTYFDSTNLLSHRIFDFHLRDQEQLVLGTTAPVHPASPGTSVTLRNFDILYGPKCPVEPSVVQQRIIGHFMQIFAAELSPAIYLIEGSISTDLRFAFKELIKDSVEEQIVVNLSDLEPAVAFTIRHIRASKAIRPDGNQKNYNWLFMSANQRAVDDTPIDEAIGLKALRDEEVYVGCVYGTYLDDHVNQERTAFTFSVEEGRLIRRALVTSIMTYLQSYVKEIQEKKKSISLKVVDEYPQFLYLQGEMQEFVEHLAPGATSKEQIFVEMCRNRFRKINQFNKIEKALLSAPKYTDEVKTQMSIYQKFVEKQQQGVLAEYVLARKSVIDILEKYMGFQDGTDKDYLEEAVHKLIVPMRTDSTRLKIEDHQLWLLDDRLAFYAYFASDKKIKTYTDRPDEERPDIAFFYDTCFAWQEEDASNTVVLVEFKRPNRNNYNGEDNPLRQLIGYINQIKGTTTLRDELGRTFSPRLKTAAYHCYIVADLTETLRSALSGFPFNDTPDGLGMIGYLRNPDAFVEVISYAKLLSDAKKRNAIFFKKIGISDVDPSADNASSEQEVESEYTTTS